MDRLEWAIAVRASSENTEGFPERVGRYELLVPVASGGMATVYLARHRGVGGFERDVALKLTHASLGTEPDTAYELIEEAKLASRIRHPNVVAVLDAGDDQNGVFLVMEYIEGDTLAGLLRAHRRGEQELPLEIALRALLDALAGLHAAHELHGEDGTPLGLVHRDFSPQNVLVGIDGLGRLSDFGIAKAISRAGFTGTGTIKGKLGYMSPEQVRGRPLDRRSDVWAAGVVAWELLTRRRLFTGSDQSAIFFKIVSEDAPRIRSVKPDVPQRLDEVVASALVREPDGRTRSADELRRRIEEACTAANLRLASTSEVASFMEAGLAERLATRRAQIAEVRARRGAPPVDEETKTETFVHRRVPEPARPATPTPTGGARRALRAGLIAAAIVVPAGVLAARAAGTSVTGTAATAVIASTPQTSVADAPSGTTTSVDEEAGALQAGATPAPMRPGARSGSAPRRAGPPPRRPIAETTASSRSPHEGAATAPLTQPRSPFRNPYEDGR